MNKKIFVLTLLINSVSLQAFAQSDFIESKEGKPVLYRRILIRNCLDGLHKGKTDQTAIDICECQVNKLDGHFSNKAYRAHTKNGKIDIEGLLNEDSAFRKEFEACFTASGKATLINAEGFEKEFVNSCIQNLKKNSEKKLDSISLVNFCTCQINLIKTKKISDEEMETLKNPNSLLFYEIMYKCGNPFSGHDPKESNWNETGINDITGPAADTISILSFNGMTYIKLKTGSMVQFWLFDTGAGDLLINKDMEDKLKLEGILSTSNFLGTAEYEMANGSVDTCRRYKLSQLRLGKFSINNVDVAVTDKGKKIIIGRSLLNKFSAWALDNKQNTLTLSK